MAELDDLEAEFMGDLGLIESARLTKIPTNRIKCNAAKNLKFTRYDSPKKKRPQVNQAQQV